MSQEMAEGNAIGTCCDKPKEEPVLISGSGHAVEESGIAPVHVAVPIEPSDGARLVVGALVNQESATKCDDLTRRSSPGASNRINPTVEHQFWRQNYAARPYVHAGVAYDQFAPAYQFGWESQVHHDGRPYDEIEPLLKRDWERIRGRSQLGWHNAKGAVRDGWDRGRAQAEPVSNETH